MTICDNILFTFFFSLCRCRKHLEMQKLTKRRMLWIIIQHWKKCIGKDHKIYVYCNFCFKSYYLHVKQYWFIKVICSITFMVPILYHPPILFMVTCFFDFWLSSLLLLCYLSHEIVCLKIHKITIKIVSKYFWLVFCLK